jgi:hypothetical protein
VIMDSGLAARAAIRNDAAKAMPRLTKSPSFVLFMF